MRAARLGPAAVATVLSPASRRTLPQAVRAGREKAEEQTVSTVMLADPPPRESQKELEKEIQGRLGRL